MKIQVCQNNHVYDIEKYQNCPLCGAKKFSSESNGNHYQKIRLKNIPSEKDALPTISPYDSLNTYFVTGWLVCIEGSQKGRDYSLHYGCHKIGNFPSCDIFLNNNTETEICYCSIIYDPKSNRFYLSPKEETDVFINHKIVRRVQLLQASDFIQIGSEIFEFIPFCTEEKTWES